MILKYRMMIITIPVAIPKKIMYQLTMALNFISFPKLKWMTFWRKFIFSIFHIMSACSSQPCKIVVNWIFLSYPNTLLTFVKFQCGTLVTGTFWVHSRVAGPKLLGQLTWFLFFRIYLLLSYQKKASPIRGKFSYQIHVYALYVLYYISGLVPVSQNSGQLGIFKFHRCPFAFV